MSWRLPEPIKLEKVPTPRPPRPPSYGGRMLAGVAGLAFGAAALTGVWRSLHDATGQGSPIGALAMLMPTALMLRYALTGQAKVG